MSNLFQQINALNSTTSSKETKTMTKDQEIYQKLVSSHIRMLSSKDPLVYKLGNREISIIDPECIPDLDVNLPYRIFPVTKDPEDTARYLVVKDGGLYRYGQRIGTVEYRPLEQAEDWISPEQGTHVKNYKVVADGMEYIHANFVCIMDIIRTNGSSESRLLMKVSKRTLMRQRAEYARDVRRFAHEVETKDPGLHFSIQPPQPLKGEGMLIRLESLPLFAESKYFQVEIRPVAVPTGKGKKAAKKAAPVTSCPDCKNATCQCEIKL